MVHPCGADRESDGTTDLTRLHACEKPTSSTTLCGASTSGTKIKTKSPVKIDDLVGFATICNTCYSETNKAQLAK